MSAKLDRDIASRMVVAPRAWSPRQIADELEAALAEIDRLTEQTELRGKTVADLAFELGTVKGKMDRMCPVVDAAERWTDSGKVHDEVVMDAVRAYRASKEST